MKRTKFYSIQLILLSIVAIAISSCQGEVVPNTTFSFQSDKSEYTAGYVWEDGKAKEIIPAQSKGSFEHTLTGTYLVSSLILDQRNSNGTTNWNNKNGKDFPLNTANASNPSVYFTTDNFTNIKIYSEPTTPAFYNQLCAEYWNEPIKNGELSKAWQLHPYSGFTSDYNDDMIKFSAFDNKVSYKPGKLRTAGFNKIVDLTQNEVYSTFTIDNEVLPDLAFNYQTVQTYYEKGDKAEVVKIEYRNGTELYSIKFFKIIDFELNPVIYIYSSDGVSTIAYITAVTDDVYSNY